MNVLEATADSAAVPLSRRERKKERTRREIYSAAMKLFLRRGFDAVTIDDICRAADVARGTFFLHFPAKESLLYEYGERANAELAALLQVQRGSATAALRLALKTLAERASRQPEVISLLTREVLMRPVVFAEHEEQTRTFVQLLGAVIRRGQAQGEFRRKVEPLIAAVALGSAFFALVYEWSRRGGELDIEGAIAQTLDVILNGLGESRAHPRRSATRAGKARL
jgi:AcrR family transcriptional regulator